jgi:hypothetical protein
MGQPWIARQTPPFPRVFVSLAFRLRHLDPSIGCLVSVEYLESADQS